MRRTVGLPLRARARACRLTRWRRDRAGGGATRALEGVFSTRSPHRPNPIGLHRVDITAIERRRTRVRHLEALGGTPIIDIKPVTRSPPFIPIHRQSGPPARQWIVWKYARRTEIWDFNNHITRTRHGVIADRFHSKLQVQREPCESVSAATLWNYAVRADSATLFYVL